MNIYAKRLNGYWYLKATGRSLIVASSLSEAGAQLAFSKAMSKAISD